MLGSFNIDQVVQSGLLHVGTGQSNDMMPVDCFSH